MFHRKVVETLTLIIQQVNLMAYLNIKIYNNHNKTYVFGLYKIETITYS